MDRRLRLLILFPYLAWFGVLILGPFIWMLAMSFARRDLYGQVTLAFQFDSYKTLFSSLYLNIFIRTTLFAGIAAIISIFLAYPLAFFVARQSPANRAYWFSIVLIPFWTNYLVRILSFMDFLRSEPFGWSGLYQVSGIIACMTYNAIPIAFLPLYVAIEKIDVVLYDAARDLGASSWHVFRNVIWPLSSTGRKGAFFLVFIPGLGEFLIPELVGGGRTFVLGNFLQNQFLSARNWPLGASAVSLVFLFTILGAVLIHGIQRLPKRKGTVG